MKHLHSQQSGLASTLTCKQFVKRVRTYGKSVVLFAAGEIGQKHTPGRQLARQCQGFSLVETFVAITILLIVIVGPMTISSAVSKSTSFSSEQVTAFLLAQEGAELAQKARDDLQLDSDQFGGSNPSSWGDFTDDDISTGFFADCFRVAASNFGCGLELNTDAAGTFRAPRDCGSAVNLANCRLYLNNDVPTRARYTHQPTDASGDPNESTPYTRVITFEPITHSGSPGPDEIKVISKVMWRSSSFRRSQEVVVETFLLNVNGN